jgi:hypothetical protein
MKKYLIILILFISLNATAQTDMDGLMMDKNYFCAGVTHSISTWKNYWEGTFKRDNQNLGKVKSTTSMIMGNYGVANKFNIIFGLPYITSKATAGQLKGQQGLQDLSLFAKWVALEKQTKNGTFKGILIGGLSTPVSKYTPDLLPLSIGQQCKNAIARIMLDYQKGNWFATASSSYLYKSNVKLDRNSYYTTQMHYTNIVQMPNVINFNMRGGYRSDTWIVEAFANTVNCLKGFDISRNNMPFVSNKMNATTLGLHIKYDTDFVNGLSLVADGITTIAGRNVGQTSILNFGVFYIMDFSKKKTKELKK